MESNEQQHTEGEAVIEEMLPEPETPRGNLRASRLWNAPRNGVLLVRVNGELYTIPESKIRLIKKRVPQVFSVNRGDLTPLKS